MILMACLGASGAVARAQGLGQFTHDTDVGTPKLAGSAAYDRSTKQYLVTSAGANMFGARDEFHFVWRKLKGDFIVQAHVRFQGPGVTEHRKAGIMARSSLDAGAAYVDVTVHGAGPQALQLRRTAGANTEMMIAAADPVAANGNALQPTPDADVVQLERHGDLYTVSIEKFGQAPTRQQVDKIDLGDKVYVGLFLCAHNADVVEKAAFTDVRIVRPSGAR
jgi:regulation of enolase protein 1 (concanavalin A-like superfamily)